jgi:hypothetical protein
MRIFLFVLLIGFMWCQPANAQLPGCMDPASSNYNPLATISDGSCIYPDGAVSLKNLKKVVLPNTINEVSGMAFINGKLYGHNDSGGQPAIYEIDTTNGSIVKTITLQGATNIDWEDITQDVDFVYVGDFGNNESGNRTDLKIYRFPKSAIANITGASGTIPASDITIINFRYEDQTDFNPNPPNNTRYDCESVIYDNGQLHLFTKNWISNYTVHYILSANPLSGMQIAMRKDSLNTQGTLITSAIKINAQTIALLGYEVTGYPSGAIWFISGFSDINHVFIQGNKRKVDLGKIVDLIGGGGIGQIEGIALAGPERVLISNEFFSRTVSGITFTVPQNLYGLIVSPWIAKTTVLPMGIYDFSAKINGNKVLLNWKFDSHEADHFAIEMSQDGLHFSTIGTVKYQSAAGHFSFIDDQPFVSTEKFYRIKVIKKDGNHSYSKILSVKTTPKSHLKLKSTSFSDKINFNFYCDKNEVIQLGLVDLYGRTVVTKKIECSSGNHSYELNNLSFLSRSLYFVTAITTDALLVEKVMKN